MLPEEPMADVPDLPLELLMEPPDMLEQADSRVTMAAMEMSLNMV